jgi:hypothetical protein
MFVSQHEIELRLRKNHLFAQYQELICLRAEIARLLNPLKISPPRKQRNRRPRDVRICTRSHQYPDSLAAD